MRRLSACTFSFYLPMLIVGIVGTSLAHDVGVHTGVIAIMSPKDHAVLDSGSGIKLAYDVHLSPRGDHLVIDVDDRAPIIDRHVSGCPCSMALPRLVPGRHSVTVREAMAGHALTGIESTVRFTVK